MWLGILYPLYGRSFEITPCFNEKVLEGEVCFKGRIRLGTILRLILGMVVNRYGFAALKYYFGKKSEKKKAAKAAYKARKKAAKDRAKRRKAQKA